MTKVSCALTGLRVIDLTQAIAGPHCTALLAGLGADVIKVEKPPLGDPARQRPHLFAALNGRKQSVVLDLRTEAVNLLEMLGEADVLVESYRPGTLARFGLAPETLLQRFPNLVITSLSNFGQTGPYRDFEASEAVLVALGGLMALCGEPDRPPLKSAVPLAQYAAGSLAAVGTLMALAGVRAGLPGQHVDVSIMEVVLQCLEHTIISCTHRHHIRRRMGSRHPDNHPMTIWPARDGYVGASIGFGQWDLLCAMTGHPELAEDESLLMGYARRARADEIDAIFLPWFRERGVDEIVRLGQTFRLPFGYVLTPRGLLSDPHLMARGFFQQVRQPDGEPITLPGPPFRASASAWQRGPAPRLGSLSLWERARVRANVPGSPRPHPTLRVEISHRERFSMPLEGVRVLDLTHQWAGPFATRILADYGADVIKIESLGRIDSVRYAALPDDEPGEHPWNRGGYFHKQNRNKRSLTLDLAHSLGKEVFLRLAKTSDIVLDNYAPRVMRQLGLDYASLKDTFPHLIVVNMPGYGTDGPYENWVAFGTSIEGMSGISSLTGYADGPPMRTGVAFPDAVAGISAALACLAALDERRRTGVGQHVEVAQREAAVTFLAEFIAETACGAQDPPRTGNRDRECAPQGVYPCKGEDAWVAVSVRSDDEWRRLSRVLGLPATTPCDANTRRAKADEIDRWIAAWTSCRTPREAMLELQRAGVPAGAVLTNAELLADPHLAAREFFVTVDHPETGAHPYVGFPFKLSHTPASVRRAGPSLGEHNREILRQLLGLSDAEVAELVAEGVIGDRPRGM